MFKTVTSIFALLSFAILSFIWILIGSNIIYYLKGLFKNLYVKSNPWIYSLIAGMILEIFLALLSIILSGVFSAVYDVIGNGILSGLYDGACFSALFSPLTSFIGSALGIRCRKAPWKYFIFK